MEQALTFVCPACGCKEDVADIFLRLLGPPECDGATLPFTGTDNGVFRSPHVPIVMEAV